jgi:DNA-binding NarL/FixJ family response regulator
MSLTKRQQEVAELVADGCSAREIGRQLGIAERTVVVHMQDAAKRLGGTTDPRHQLIVWGVRPKTS